MAIVGTVTAKVGGATGGTTSAVNTTGSSLIVLVNSFLGGGEPTVSDSKSNIWTQLTIQSAGAGSGSLRMSYVLNPTVGSGHTFTLTGVTTAGVWRAYSGVDTSSPFDQQNGAVDASGLPSSFQAGSITPGVNNELIVGGCMFAAAGEGVVTIGGGFSIIDFLARVGGGVNPGCYLSELIQTTATASNPAWAFTQGPTVGATQASFKASAGGAASVNRCGPFVIG